MKIDENILDHLSGRLFRTDFRFDLSKEKFAPVSREKAIAELVKSKKVIHIGCTDHIQIIKEKIKHDLWLHKLITQNATECIGIDIDKQSIDFVKTELGYNNVLNGDILNDDFPAIREAEWDYAVFGEVLEHLDNPVNFLEVFRKKYGKNVREFIVSVPTVYNKNIFKAMLDYREIINSDHRFWFTPFTILKIIALAGLQPKDMKFVNLQKLSFTELVTRKLRKLSGLKFSYPFYYYKTLIVIGTFN